MNVSRFANLAQWLAWQEGLHPRAIDLGLDRLSAVLDRLGLKRPPSYQVITVAGTNGKGSCVALLEAILRAGGYRVGAYTSPHLIRYNERIRIEGAEVDDNALCDAFARIDAARGDISLTYFEFGTLAALDLFERAGVEVAVLEVGLGGRLDAVNVLDADGALVTMIDIDHCEWLGPDRESIGREKAGIFRRGRPAVCGDRSPPRSLLDHAAALEAPLYLLGRDYDFQRRADNWCWWHGMDRLDLPLPSLAGSHQTDNAAAVLMLLRRLADALPLTLGAIDAGLSQARIAGRFQVIPGAIEWILDVTHNPHGAANLARCLWERPCAGRTHAVVGILKDKDAIGIARALANSVDHWYAATLLPPRGRTGDDLVEVLREADVAGTISHFDSVTAACRAAAREAQAGDRIVVFGSFHTVGEALTASLPIVGALSSNNPRVSNLG